MSGQKDSNKPVVLRCLSWNVHSIVAKCDEVMEHVIDFDADIVFLSELWLKSDLNSITAKVKDYNYLLHHSIRKNSTKARGGGVGVLVSNRYEIKKDRCIKSIYESFEYGLYSLKLDKCEKLLLISIYRCQHINISIFFDQFTSLLEQVVTINSCFVLAGDLNIHYEKDTDSSKKLKGILSSFGLSQNVVDATNKFGHIIDHVISPIEGNAPVSNVEVHDVSLSDHFLVSFKLSCSVLPAKTKQITFRNLKSINQDFFASELSQCLASIDLTVDFGSTVASYNKALSTLLDNHAPEITTTVKVVNKAPWFNHEYRILRQQRRKAEKRFRRSKLEVDRLRFVELCKMCTQTSFIS